MINTTTEHNESIEKGFGNIRNQGMIKSQHWRTIIQLTSDSIAIITGYLLFFWIRFESGIYFVAVKPGTLEIGIGLVFFLAFWLMMFFFSGMFKNWYERSPFEEFWAIIKVTLVGCIIIIFAVKIDSQSSPRQLFLIYFLLHSILLIGGRITARFIERYLRIKGIFVIPVIIVGDYNKAVNYYKKFKRVKTWGYLPQAVLVIDDDEYRINSGNTVIYDDVYFGTVNNLNDA